MLIVKGQLLKSEVLPPRGDFPPSALVTLFDPENGETLKLVADSEVHDHLASRDQLDPIELAVSWRRVELVPPVGKGNAYRMKIRAVL